MSSSRARSAIQAWSRPAVASSSRSFRTTSFRLDAAPTESTPSEAPTPPLPATPKAAPPATAASSKIPVAVLAARERPYDEGISWDYNPNVDYNRETLTKNPYFVLPDITPLKATHGIHVATMTLQAHSPRPLDVYAKFCLLTAHALGIPSSGVRPLPATKQLFTVIKAPFAYKKSMENFERRYHKRRIMLYDANPEVLDLFLRYIRTHSNAGVGCRVKVHEWAEFGYGNKEIEQLGAQFDELTEGVKDEEINETAIQQRAKELIAQFTREAEGTDRQALEEVAQAQDEADAAAWERMQEEAEEEVVHEVGAAEAEPEIVAEGEATGEAGEALAATHEVEAPEEMEEPTMREGAGAADQMHLNDPADDSTAPAPEATAFQPESRMAPPTAEPTPEASQEAPQKEKQPLAISLDGSQLSTSFGQSAGSSTSHQGEAVQLTDEAAAEGPTRTEPAADTSDSSVSAPADVAANRASPAEVEPAPASQDASAAKEPPTQLDSEPANEQAQESSLSDARAEAEHESRSEVETATSETLPTESGEVAPQPVESASSGHVEPESASVAPASTTATADEPVRDSGVEPVAEPARAEATQAGAPVDVADGDRTGSAVESPSIETISNPPPVPLTTTAPSPASSTTTSSEAVATEPEAPAKKRRGRPPKVKPVEDEPTITVNTASTADSGEVPAAEQKDGSSAPGRKVTRKPSEQEMIKSKPVTKTANAGSKKTGQPVQDKLGDDLTKSKEPKDDAK